MRELAKSMVAFSWAVGLFGFQQLTKVMTPAAEPPDVTAAQLDDVARAAERHLSEQYAQQFRAGDEWQRRIVDALFDAASMRSFDPRSVAATFDPRPMMNDVDPRRVIQSGVDLLQRSVNMVRQAATPTSAPSQG
jgi:hypothetical protein